MACETFPDSYNYGAVTRPSVASGRRWNDPAGDISDKWSQVVDDYSGKVVLLKETDL